MTYVLQRQGEETRVWSTKFHQGGLQLDELNIIQRSEDGAFLILLRLLFP